MKDMTILKAITVGFLAICVSAYAQLPAFPGAEGFGAYANGGRGGDVYTVMNLNSSGPGSLRYGVETAPVEGRTIVFAVSGYIPISYNGDTGNQTVRIVQNNITIAGQTAPGDGIGLKDGRVLITGDDVVIRHIRVRHGKYGGAGDCINIESSANNTMLDHVSLMFSTDENISFFNSAVDNFTMQYCTSSWGMERHNAGGLWDLDHGSCHHTLWAHHRTRSPKARPYGLLEWINNVTYHWRNEAFIMGDSQTATDWYANVIGCYYISIADYDAGLDSTPLSKARIASDGQPNFHLYLNDTLIDANGNGVLDGTDQGYGIVSGDPYPSGGSTPGSVSYDQSASSFTGAPEAISIDDPLTAYKKVISSAGALRLDAAAGSLRDELDTLLIESVMDQESILVAKDTPVTSDPAEPPSSGEQHLADAYGISNNGFGTLDSSEYPADSDGDGLPDFWEMAVGSDPDTASHNDPVPVGSYVPASPSGYTMLEEYLHFKALPHAVIHKNSSVTVDLRKYTQGFTKSPAYSITGAWNGTCVQYAEDGTTPSSTGPIVVFTPTANFSGRAAYEFSVTDADGSSWTQLVAVFVDDVDLHGPPSVPAGLTASAGDAQVSLSWSSSTLATGYIVKRSVLFGGPYIPVLTNATTSCTDSGLVNGITYFYVVSALNSFGESEDSDYASFIPTELYRINSGGTDASPYVADAFYSGGGDYSNTHTIDTSGVVDPAPEAVYQSERSGSNFQYALTDLEPGTAYRVRLHFSEIYWGESGKRVFNVFINGTQVLTDFDAFVEAGAKDTAVVREFNVVADGGGQITVQFVHNGISDDSNAKISGIEVYRAPPPALYRVNAGGGAEDPFSADAYYTGGSSYTKATAQIDTSDVSEPAPEAVYRSEHNHTHNYSFPGLVPGNNYFLRLHFAEIYHDEVGERTFDVSINGEEVLNGFDVFAEAGAKNKAIVREFSATANESGQVVLLFENIVDNAKVSGIEIFEAPTAPRIVTQPSNQTVIEGLSVSFAVDATGDPVPSYQWRKNGEDLPGQTNFALDISDVQSGDEGLYSVSVYSIAGIVVSSNALLSVAPSPSLSSSVTNGFLYVRWPGISTGWSLEYCTNLVLEGAPAWEAIEGMEATNAVGFPVDSLGLDTVYFRLAHPE